MAYSFIRTFSFQMMKHNQALNIHKGFSSFVVALSTMGVAIIGHYF